ILHLTISSCPLDYLKRQEITGGERAMASDTRDLVTSYIKAVGENRLEALPAMLDPDAEFIVGDTTLRGAEAFVGGFRRLTPIILGNEIRKRIEAGSAAVRTASYGNRNSPRSASHPAAAGRIFADASPSIAGIA